MSGLNGLSAKRRAAALLACGCALAFGLALPVCAQGGPPAAAAGTSLQVQVPGPQGPLQGTLRMPTGTPRAAVLLVPGSGPTDRDGNNPLGVRAASYRLLAEALAARGVASLRIDKRGMFGSGAAVPDANAVTVNDYADDVQAWLGLLGQRSALPCAWVLGHSEGGLVALAAAARGTPPLRGACGLLLVAAPGRPLGVVLREQLRANPANAPVLGQAEAAIAALEQGRRADTREMHPALLPLFNPAVQGFLISVFALDPARLVADTRLPVLVLQGQQDLQVGVTDARRLQQAQPAAQLVLLPGVNHVLKAVPAGDARANMASYGDPALPLAPGVAEALLQFIERHPASAAAPAAPQR